MMTLKGGITVTSGQHRLDNLATVATDATWDIAAGSSLTRAGNADTLTMAANRKITKTGAGTLVLQSSNTNILGTLEVQQGVLRVSTADHVLGSATVALNGGVVEIFSNAARANASATTTVTGESTVRLDRSSSGAGQSHVMGALQLGSSKLTVTANDLNTSGTAEVSFGATTLSNNATLEVLNSTGGAATRVTLGEVGETGGSRGLAKTGHGVLVLSGTNTYTGGTTVLEGTMNVTGALADSGAVTVNGAAATYTVGASDTVGAVTLQAGTINGSGTLTGSSYSVESGLISATLGGSGALTKSTAGQATLAASNTFAGAVNVQAGLLELSSSSAPVTFIVPSSTVVPPV
jgi:autotransporter-associated beta strand protein